MSTAPADVLVVGAGIVGASCAWHLAQRGLKVVVVERESAPAMHSTGRSMAGVRTQFTTTANIGLSMYSLPVYREFVTTHGRDIGYEDIGYLLLVPEGAWDRHLEAVDLQRSMGAPVDVLDPEEGLRYVPYDTHGLAGVTYGPWDGIIDPHGAALAWLTMARDAGVDVRMNAPVQSIAAADDAGWSVVAGGETIHARWVVNAAGAWAGTVAEMAGLSVPVVPKRIQIFLSAPIEDDRTYPLTIDLATGVYVRSEGSRVLIGLDNLAQDAGFTEGVDPEWMEHVLMTGAPRFPWWTELGIDRKGSWWGYYAVSPDNSPIIEPHPDAPSWVDACGFSGHGVMHAPATGRAVSEFIADGVSHTVDVSAFTHARFDAGPDAEGREVEANIF